jgi:phosphoglycerate dehydrogenase-like enzyme
LQDVALFCQNDTLAGTRYVGEVLHSTEKYQPSVSSTLTICEEQFATQHLGYCFSVFEQTTEGLPQDRTSTKKSTGPYKLTLKGKRILILGGTSGIGLAVAEAAKAEGSDVVVISSKQSRVDAALRCLPRARRLCCESF